VSGQLRLQYRPRWLVFGGAFAGICALVWMTAAARAWRTASRPRVE